MEKDLFEEVALRAGCEYISDLRIDPYNSYAKEMMKKRIGLREYSLNILSDMYEYLYGKTIVFASYEDAEAVFA